jgi:hypothetical protein
MCFAVVGQPYRLVLERHRSEDGTPIEIYTFALGKVTSKQKNGEHKSSQGFTYPIGQTATDPKAQVGSHAFGLHLVPTLDCADQLSSYGSHRLAVLPGPKLWDPPFENTEQQTKCWHSGSVTTLFCLDCSGFTLDDLKNPDFWQSLTKPPKRSSRRKSAKTDEFVLHLPRASVWHNQAAASRN